MVNTERMVAAFHVLWRRRHPRLGTFCSFLAGSKRWSRLGEVGLPLDDTWIHLDYARSLATQGFFYYNPGVVEAGMSSPMWVILLAIPLKLGIGPAASAKMLSFVFSILTAFAAYHLAVDLTHSSWVGWVAGILCTLEPNFSFARVSGMEVPLLSFLLLTALLASHRRRFTIAGILFGWR